MQISTIGTQTEYCRRTGAKHLETGLRRFFVAQVLAAAAARLIAMVNEPW
jgi:hypothetical protein